MQPNLTNRQIAIAHALAEQIQKGGLDECFYAIWGTGLSPCNKPILVWGEGEWGVGDYSFADFEALAQEGFLRIKKDGNYPFPKGVKGYAPTDQHYSCSATAQLFSLATTAAHKVKAGMPVSEDPEPYKIEIFISHSSVDAIVAELVVKLIRAAVDVSPQAIRCTSVDGYRLPTGVETDHQIKREVRGSRCFIALLTPSSLRSTYVLFELGARWGTQLPFFPVLAKGTTPSDLWAPLSSLNAVSCYTPSQIHQIISDLAHVIGKDLSPPATYAPLVQELLAAAAEGASTLAAPEPVGDSAAVVGSPANELLELILREPDPEMRGIVEIAARSEPGKTYFFPRVQYAGNPLSMKSRQFREAVTELCERNLIFPPEYDVNTNTQTYEYRS